MIIKNTKQGVLDTINRVYYQGLTTTSGGNISCMDNDGRIFITPSGVDKGSLAINDIMEVTADKKVIGPHTPSMELPFHSNIYKERNDIRAVVHAHAPAVVAYATARQVPNTAIASCYADILGKVGDSCYDIPGSISLGEIVKAEFVNGYNCVMMHNHGATVGGATLEEAFVKYEALNNCCDTIINARILGNVFTVSGESDYKVKAELGVGGASAEENAIKEEMASFLRRSYYQKLVAVGYGTLAYKLPNGDILFNPDNIGRDKIQAHEIAKFSDGVLVGSTHTDIKYMGMIKAIFDSVPEAVTCFVSMPNAIMGFAVSHTYFDSKLIPESYIMLKNVTQLPYGISSKQVAENMDTTKPVAVIDNECAVCIGKNITKVFDRMEVLDFSARSVISATNIAKIFPINDEQSADIDRTFNGW